MSSWLLVWRHFCSVTGPQVQERLIAFALPVVDLARDSELVLVRLTKTVREAIAQQAERDDLVPGFYELTASVAALASNLSSVSPVAYVHLEFFGGTGFRAAIGWQDGRVAWGPQFTANNPGEDEHFEVQPYDGDLAINRVLRWLGVSRGGARGEFGAAGLTRFRFTDEWYEARRRS